MDIGAIITAIVASGGFWAVINVIVCCYKAGYSRWRYGLRIPSKRVIVTDYPVECDVQGSLRPLDLRR